MFQCNRLFLVISLIVQTLCCQGQKDRDYWIERYLSVSYPLQHIKVTSHYGNRKDPFTGKTAFHSGLDLKARNEEVLSMFDGYVECGSKTWGLSGKLLPPLQGDSLRR